jgi:hypothetical protein
VSFGICCSYPSAQSADTVRFSVTNLPFTSETESGATIARICGGSASASYTSSLEAVTDDDTYPTVSYEMTRKAAIAGEPASPFSLDVEGSEAIATFCDGGGVPLPSCLPTGYGVYTAEPS